MNSGIVLVFISALVVPQLTYACGGSLFSAHRLMVSLVYIIFLSHCYVLHLLRRNSDLLTKEKIVQRYSRVFFHFHITLPLIYFFIISGIAFACIDTRSAQEIYIDSVSTKIGGIGIILALISILFYLRISSKTITVEERVKIGKSFARLFCLLTIVTSMYLSYAFFVIAPTLSDEGLILPLSPKNTINNFQNNQSDDVVSKPINSDNHTANSNDQNFMINLGPGESLSGPILAYTKDGQTIQTTYSVGTTTLERKSLSGTTALVKDGPYEYYLQSNSQCGACAHAAFNIYYFDFSKGTSTRAYGFPFHTYDLNDTDFTISSDWKKITNYEYLHKNDSTDAYDYDNYKKNFQWSATDYCFSTKTNVFEECGTRMNVQPPTPRNFTPDRQDS